MTETYVNQTSHEPDSHVMSEKVQSLAASVYQEFERMIKRYDEDVVKELMPLVVGILENLDVGFQEKQEIDVELELLRDDNEQLLTQYEREKQLRKTSEQKNLELEDAIDEERKELQGNVESLESIVRMLELKGKNAQDHISRLEEKEGEMKKEYNKLHERYTDLFKTHMDYMERTKLMIGGDKISDMSASPRTRGFHMPSLKSVNPSIYHSGDTPVTPEGGFGSDSLQSPGKNTGMSLRSELKDVDTSVETAEKEQNTESVVVTTKGTATKHPATRDGASSPTKDTDNQISSSANGTPSDSSNSTKRDKAITQTVTETSKEPVKSDNESSTEKSSTSQTGSQVTDTNSTTAQSNGQASDSVVSRSNAPSLSFERYVEASFEEDAFGDILPSPEIEDLPQRKDINKTQGNVSSIYDEMSINDMEAIGDIDDGVDVTVSDNFFGMGKEVENLILENTELLATKNALNIVKDDLIAKVDELSSEQEILKEEITSLQVMRDKLKTRVSDLESDLKKTNQELEKLKEKQASGQDGEEGAEGEVPMAQRKRFTRVEMARVLMERNQYKERLMELQEAVRWTEMIRASKEHPDVVPANKKKGSIWNFFSNLFNPSDKPKNKRAHPGPTLRYSAPTSVKPVGDPNKKSRDNYNMGEKSKAYDFLQDDLLTEKSRKEREKERREQYKQVRAHVKKDDGRMQAYGWSLPAKFTPTSNKESSSGRTIVPVPVPVYCRPLVEQDDTLKIWCAAGVNLLGGKTRDGGSIVGASVFYSNPPVTDDENNPTNEIEKLDRELKMGVIDEDGFSLHSDSASSRSMSPTSSTASRNTTQKSPLFEHEKDVKSTIEELEKTTSVVWICTTTHNQSQVTVIDANNPSDVIENFHVSSGHVLCIASVPGCLETDFQLEDVDIVCTKPLEREEEKDATSSSGDQSQEVDATETIGGITLVKAEAPAQTPTEGTEEEDIANANEDTSTMTTDKESRTDHNTTSIPSPEPFPADQKPYEFDDHYFEDTCYPLVDPLDGSISPDAITITKARGSPSKSGGNTPTQSDTSSERKLPGEPTVLVKDGVSDVGLNLISEEMEKLSSLLPTMWIGTQSGSLYIHSAVSNWKKCLHSVKLKDSVLAISHVKGHVFVALADGTVAMFRRNKENQWDLRSYYVIDLGKPHHSVRCLSVVANKYLWCGYRNKVHVVNPKTLHIEKSFDAHPRKESQIRQMAWVGDGVWVSIRLDSTLRLYHAYTHQHLQDVDIEPYVSKMLGTGKLGFSFVRITSLLISCSRLWIGTGNGVIISVPLSETNKQNLTTATAGRPGGVVRVYNDQKTDTVTPGSFVPYCSMAQAQLSFHGHKDAVKFFAAVPGHSSSGVSEDIPKKTDQEDNDNENSKDTVNKTMLVISGGEGYIDFRLGDTEEEVEGSLGGKTDDKKESSISKGDRSHLIVWQVFNDK